MAHALVYPGAGAHSAQPGATMAAHKPCPMPAPPLTHHDILGLVEPFSRRGRHLDLAASCRLQRRLAFKAVEHAASPGETPALHETLQLDCHGPASFKLLRTLTGPAGLQASLQASGPDPGALLAAVEAVTPAQQFVQGDGFCLARCHVLPSTGGLLMTRGLAQIGGLRLTLNVPDARGVAAELTLGVMHGDALDLPEDLLAVLGWNWTRLVPERQGWTSKLRLPRDPFYRSRDAQAALDLAAAHLARTLAEPPGRYHDTHLAARRLAVLRRSIPALTGLVLLAVVGTAASQSDGHNLGGGMMLLYHLPTAVLAGAFCLQELPRFEIPPLPRRSDAPDWRRR
jgi:hypothetical protein